MTLGATIQFKEGVTSEEAASALMQCVHVEGVVCPPDMEVVDWQGAYKAGGGPIEHLPPIPRCSFCDNNATHMDSVNGFPCCPLCKRKDVGRVHIHEVLPDLVPIHDDEMYEAALDLAKNLSVVEKMTESQVNYFHVLLLIIEEWQEGASSRTLEYRKKITGCVEEDGVHM